MTTKQELQAMARALVSSADSVADQADTLAAKATELKMAVDALEEPTPDPDPDPTPDPDPDPDPDPGGAVLAPEARTLVTGPYLAPNTVYTGQQMGGLYRDGTGTPMRADSNGWPNYTRPQGQYDGGWCGIETSPTSDEMMRLTLTRAGHPYYSATTLLEQHLIFDQDTPANGAERAAFEVDFERVSGEGFKTIKLGGLVGFDGDWMEWPGGGGYGPANFSVRAVLNDAWGQGPRLTAYLYLGTNTQDLQVDGGDVRYYWSNDNHSVEVNDLAGPTIEANTPYRVRVEADVPGGSCRLLLSENGGPWTQTMLIESITWATQGNMVFNRGYPVVMYGGRDESFAPQNPEQTGVIDYGRIRFAELA